MVVTRHQVFEYYGLKNMEDLVYCEPTPESVADTIGKVLFSEEIRKKLSKKGPIIAQKFDYYKIAKSLLNKKIPD